MVVKPVSGNIYMTSHGLVIVTGESSRGGIQWISAGHTRSSGTTQLNTITVKVPANTRTMTRLKPSNTGVSISGRKWETPCRITSGNLY